MSNSLDPDQARHFFGPDLDPNCLLKLSADGTRKQRDIVNIVIRYFVLILFFQVLVTYFAICNGNNAFSVSSEVVLNLKWSWNVFWS